jgi:hypothetical protein
MAVDPAVVGGATMRLMDKLADDHGDDEVEVREALVIVVLQHPKRGWAYRWATTERGDDRPDVVAGIAAQVFEGAVESGPPWPGVGDEDDEADDDV